MTTQSPRGAALVLVLDNEPAQALADAGHPGHQLLLAYVDAVSGRNRRRPGTAAIVVPTSVRVEALLSRRSPRASELGRLRVRDVELTQRRADRCADLRRAAGGSATDATVAQAAEEFAVWGSKVTILTSDLTDLPRLRESADDSKNITIRRI